MRPGISPANAGFVGPAPKPERPLRAPFEFGIGNPTKGFNVGDLAKQGLYLLYESPARKLARLGRWSWTGCHSVRISP